MADRLTTEELDELERLHREAKRGAWYRTCTGELPLTHGAAMTFGDACLVTGAINALPRLIAAAREAERLREALGDARAALNRDRTGLAAALNAIQKEVAGRHWMRHESDGGEAGTWGSYPYQERTTDTIRREVGQAFESIGTIAHEALQASGQLADESVRAADRVLRAALAGKDGE